MSLPKIPEHWHWAEFSEVAEVKSNLVDPSKYPDYPHIAPNHIESKTGKLLEYTTIAQDGVTSAKHQFYPGQILYSKIRPYLAKAVEIDIEGLCSADMYPIEAKIERGFLLRWILSDWFTEQASGKQGRTVLPKINQAALARLKVPVPPADEQSRIVARVEELTARSKTAKEALQAIPPLLEKFRQSVLDAAFRGDLTADWRSRNLVAESGQMLLEHIRQRRKDRTERARTKSSSNERNPIDTGRLHSLPPNWCWVRMDDVCSLVTDGTHHSPENLPAGDYKYITAKNLRPWGLDLEHITYVPASVHREIYARCPVEFEDVLYIKDGVTTGLAALNSLTEQFSLLSSVALLKPERTALIPAFLKHFLNSPSTYRRLTGQMTGTAIRRIVLTQLRSAEVVLPPIEEQKQILAKVEEAFAFIHEIEKKVHIALEYRFDSSILAKAFRGELVPQNPNDEPTSELLERLRNQSPPSKAKTK